MNQRKVIECDEGVIDRVLTAATNVHRELGPGLLESVYEKALMMELDAMDLAARSQVEIPVFFRGENLGMGFRADIIVENSLLLELKCVTQISPVHLAITINYLKLLNFKRGYILNFRHALMKEGIRRVSN